jgi:predicted Rossmann fold flavoprotein
MERSAEAVLNPAVAIVGGGAAGLFAAIFAARSGARVVVFERAPKIGAKILISGGGRCNVTHEHVAASDFNGSKEKQIAKVLRSFDVASTIAFFESIGVELKREETGKLFPVSDRARTVVDALLEECRRLGVEIRLNAFVENVLGSGPFEVSADGESNRLDRVVLATGGRSVPKTGSDGHGYSIASALGHSTTATFPALVPLTLPEGHWGRSLSGLTLDARMKLRSGGGSTRVEHSGSLLFTHFGLSGPLALDISRHWIDARRTDRDAALELSFTSEDETAVARRALEARSGTTTLSFLRTFVPERLAVSLIEHEVSVPPTKTVAQCTREERQRLTRAIAALTLPISGDRGFAYAEVTAGGIPLDEVRLATMESRRTAGLHLCGEILDVDGRIGGFNFQWAWASGRLAGLGASAVPR